MTTIQDVKDLLEAERLQHLSVVNGLKSENDALKLENAALKTQLENAGNLDELVPIIKGVVPDPEPEPTPQ